ncbi:AcrR family transcriptional regulator [Cryobacterium sp. MP_M5]|uniref:TetR/AcrR family transcriptional regulator C-terminal domain-containing protein n=1 Tax=unclassified Cryobacterium TaxID=2649013 RepID=UPI0018CBE396|nr:MULTISPECIES: TetR/AcrR family transcriptional regulator C-terminal domain-containing protein [unclassified Cryobacterium]MBG6057542.1 AcrR family transcriptional regulator [Cryobacterium sp. MP_M3]MEC5175943.1 AcrR family transcriptional regulator [Cryobacterium sp. MP_M5]
MVTTAPSESTRAPVTREGAVRAAVALADRDGLDSLSMRKLARELGIEAMSLYYHVTGKDDILDGMVEVVVAEMALPADGAKWQAALRDGAESARAVLGRHPWAISLMDSRTTRATLKHHNAVIGCLRNAGFSFGLAAHAMSLLDSYVHGFALQEASLPLDESGDIGAATEQIMGRQDLMAEFPYLSEMAVAHILQPGYAYGNEFRFGVGVILDGLEAALAADAATSSNGQPPS